MRAAYKKITEDELLRQEFQIEENGKVSHIKVIGVFPRSISINYIDSDVGVSKSVSIREFEDIASVKIITKKMQKIELLEVRIGEVETLSKTFGPGSGNFDLRWSRLTTKLVEVLALMHYKETHNKIHRISSDKERYFYYDITCGNNVIGRSNYEDLEITEEQKKYVLDILNEVDCCTYME